MNLLDAYLQKNTFNQLGVYQSDEMYNVQKAREEKGKRWQQKLHQTTGGKSQTGFPHPVPLL